WLEGKGEQAAAALEEGNALDRSVFSVLIILAIWILSSRSLAWAKCLALNGALTAFLAFGLASVLWSDFPFVALKRWFRDIGNYLVILVALSDPQPVRAVRTLFRRLCYLLIPLCIVLIKYYPDMSKGYDSWTGKAEFFGAATSKNMLGVVCLV